MRLKINDLPARAKKLTENEMSVMFGSGNRRRGQACGGSCYWNCRSKRGKKCDNQYIGGVTLYCCK